MSLVCKNCHQVVTDKLGPDGKPLVVWVCENCNEEVDTTAVVTQSPAPAVQPSPTAPAVVAADPVVLDQASAQADINAAAAAIPTVSEPEPVILQVPEVTPAPAVVSPIVSETVPVSPVVSEPIQAVPVAPVVTAPAVSPVTPPIATQVNVVPSPDISNPVPPAIKVI